MKKAVIVTSLLLVTMVLHAQQKQPRLFAEVSFGPSIPVGKFADRSYADLNKSSPPGLAKNGWGANFSVGYYLNRSFGLLLSAGYSEHKQDWSAYNDYIQSIPYDGLPRIEVDGQSWKTMKAMGGGFLKLPLIANHKLNLLTKLTAGICKTAVPGGHYRAYDRNEKLLYADTEKKIELPWAFCYQAGVAVQYTIMHHLYVQLDINSFNATVQKKYPDYSPVYPAGGVRQYNISTLNVGAGIGVSF